MKYQWIYLKLILIAGLLVGLFPSSAHIGWAGKTSGKSKSTEVVVKLNPARATSIDVINREYGTSTLEILLGSQGIYRLQTPSGSNAITIADQMQDDLRFLYAEPNHLTEAPEGDGRGSWDWGGPDVAPLMGQYATALLGLADAHLLNRGNGVVVAVLDTGLQLNHPTLAAHLTTSRYDFVDDDPVPEDEINNLDDDGDGLIDEAWGHGTHVAGIVHLVAPEAQIMPLRVLDADGRGNVFVLAEALRYAAQNGAHIINLSLGTSQQSELMEDVLDDMEDRYDVLIIGAAGNLNGNNKQYPAAEEGVFGVTATDANNTKSTFANFGHWIDIAAPGSSIYSIFPPDGHAWWSSTSMAVPFVSGQAALILGVAPNTPARNVAQHIRNTAVSIESLNPGFAGALGVGRIAVAASLQALCDDAGNCQAPTDPGTVISETFGQIEILPSSSLTGTWVIAGRGYLVDTTTELYRGRGPLVVGACVRVDYHAEESTNAQPYTAVRIRTKRCANGTPMPSPTSIPTITITVSPTMTTTLTPEVTVSVTPSITDTITNTPVTTATPVPTTTLTPEVTVSVTPSITDTITNTPVTTATPVPTTTLTPEVTVSIAPSVTDTITNTPVTTATAVLTTTLTPEVTVSVTPSVTDTITNTSITTATPVPTTTVTPDTTASSTPVPSVTATPVPHPSPSETETATPVPSATITAAFVSMQPLKVTQRQGQINAVPSTGNEGIWIIGGTDYVVTVDTVLSGNLTKGRSVIVKNYTTSDGIQIALQIRAVQQSYQIFLPVLRR